MHFPVSSLNINDDVGRLLSLPDMGSEQVLHHVRCRQPREADKSIVGNACCSVVCSGTRDVG